MTFRSRRRWVSWSSGLALALACGVAAGEPSPPGDPLVVMLDQARLVRMPENVATIVVGNPLIADVSVQSGGVMVVTGKGYGITNLMALDRNGKVLMTENVQVQGAPDTVVVYRGINRESYSCTPDCNRRITLGDMPLFFEQTISQTSSRNSRAQAGATGGFAPR
ncbi:pilus assembly protein N-terminal domain-containing protein [Rhodoplanes serenus]|jgi:Flp pilus assembly secretin CpaC|uniref:pilus assembly protein N-terminal domain-containing protein n=1 Tax=Rhodoplanes serenus TaxID=200615 RepID=UPI000DAD613A|nr:pilus assembly protein N-terminal domain-containing protein [Rhodoplanes serenus]RAI34403.1 pilus assembly protein CpaC [Rhodoplanes serenus]